ncbi:MAG: radical SAM family heme chaperone HemW, partial [Chloroflexota bacterium]
DKRRPALSVYFGGGTPSLVPADEIAATLDACRAAFALQPAAEITLELNPESGDEAYLLALHHAGVNRLSIGMQSVHAEELKLYARLHTLDDVRRAIRRARAAGFENISLDLIYGSPRQTLSMWQDSLRAALALEPEHISFYGLSIEEGTTFERWARSGRIAEPDPDLAADMYEWATDELVTAGFEQYEISNWARPGAESRHNLQYWRCEPYLGLGAGAHGYANGVRYDTALRPEAYIARIDGQRAPQAFPLTAAVEHVEAIDQPTAMAEWMIMGLRLVRDGIDPEEFRARFGVSLASIYASEIEPLRAAGLLDSGKDGRLRLTRRGRLLGNQVFLAFI